MCSTREEITEAFASLATALSRVLGLTFDALTTPERLALLEHCETARRQLPSVEHTLINQIGEQSTEEELGGKLGLTLADRLRITRSEAKRRVAEAADLGQRRALTGEPLPPLLTATAKAQRHGLIGDGHVEVIRAFVHRLPSWVDLKTLEKAERDLAKQATQYRPDQLAKLAARIMDCLNPDGDYTDEDRARRRGDVRKARCRWDVAAQRICDPRAARHYRGGVGQAGRPGYVQPRAEGTVCERRALEGAGAARHPQLPTAEPRRAQRRIT